MEKKKLQDLNLLDDFLFNKIVMHPEFGEEFSRELLRIVLGKEVGKLTVVPQKVYYGADTELHGARLDVYLEDEDATICDAEPESENKDEDIKTFSRRNRFYHSKIDIGSFKSGQDYKALKDVIVIFIMPVDLLGANRMVYTMANKCLELPDLPYDDGAKTIVLYTKGIEGNPQKELAEFLRYMEHSIEENATNEAVRKIHQMVTRVKSDEEVSLEFMKIYDRERMIKESGIKIGREEGHREGLREGHREGHREGRREGHREGRREAEMENARNLFENGVSFEVVRRSIKNLTDEELQRIYSEVNK